MRIEAYSLAYRQRRLYTLMARKLATLKIGKWKDFLADMGEDFFCKKEDRQVLTWNREVCVTLSLGGYTPLHTGPDLGTRLVRVSNLVTQAYRSGYSIERLLALIDHTRVCNWSPLSRHCRSQPPTCLRNDQHEPF